MAFQERVGSVETSGPSQGDAAIMRMTGFIQLIQKRTM